MIILRELSYVTSSDQALLSEVLALPYPHSVTEEWLCLRPFLTICHFTPPNGKLVPRRRREDNFKMQLQEVGCGGMGWIVMA
jgi:hypothetical protein